MRVFVIGCLRLEPSRLVGMKAAVRARDIVLFGVGSGFRWSPQDSTHTALSVECPELTRADVWSPCAAIDGLQDKIRATLSAEPRRTAQV